MKVCFRRGYHTVYDELVKFPPEGIEYIFPPFVTPSKNKFVANIKRKLFRFYVNIFNKPNAVYVNCKGADLIHSGGGFLIKNEFPWISELEHAASCVGFQAGRLEKVKNQIEKYFSSKYCRKIVPWTNAGMKSLFNFFDTSKFKDKIEVVYPAMHVEKFHKKQKTEKPTIIFISYRFFTKGGKEVLQAYDKLKEKYDFDLIVVSNVPDQMKKKYPDIIFEKPLPRDILLRDYFTRTDIFLLPTYMDTFGMVFLEAMSYSIPIVTTNVFALPEIVEDAGFLVNADKYSWYGKDYLFAWNSWDKWSKFVEKEEKPEVVNELVEKLSLLLDDASLRKKVGEKGKKLVETKFSIEERNKKLKRIYEEAIRG